MRKSVAILGANGQIGTVLCREWLRSGGVRPVAVVRNRIAEAALRARVGAELEIRRGTISDSNDTDRLLDGCDSVVNASYASTGGFRASRLANESNISAVLRTPSVRRFVQLSSVSVYGSSRDGSSTFDRPKPTNSYGREKLAHELFTVSESKRAPERIAIVRVGHVYGAEQVMSRYILGATLNRRFRLPFGKGCASNCVSLRALAESLERAASDESAFGTYNLVDNPNHSWGDIFAWHAKSIGCPPPVHLTIEQSIAAGEAALAAAGDSMREFGRETLGALLPGGLGRLASSAAVRSRVDGLFACGPAFLESAARKAHVARAVSSQLSQIEPEFVPLPYWMFVDAVPGPGLSRAPVNVDDDSHLRSWWRRVSDPRWHD